MAIGCFVIGEGFTNLEPAFALTPFDDSSFRHRLAAGAVLHVLPKRLNHPRAR
jgi:hypothetical protein